MSHDTNPGPAHRQPLRHRLLQIEYRDIQKILKQVRVKLLAQSFNFVYSLCNTNTLREGKIMNLAIYSSNIFTGDPKQPWAEAVAVQNGLIKTVGNNKDVKKTAAPGSIEIDLPKSLVTPGFVDSHCHFNSFGFSLQNIDLRNLSSIDSNQVYLQAF